MHHQLDFVIQIVDGMTDAAVLGGVNQFWLNGLVIRPTKIMDNFFVFSDVLRDPQKIHVSALPAEAVITWHNPYYQEVRLTIQVHTTVPLLQGLTYHLRALPSAFYPFKQPVTGIKGRLEEARQVRLVHAWNMNRYHLTGPVTGGGILSIAQSQNRSMAGKLLQLREGEQKAEIWLEQGIDDNYHIPEGVPSFSEESEVFEVIEVPVDAYGLFFIALPNLQTDFVQAEAFLEFIGETQKGILKVNLNRDQLLDLKQLHWDSLDKE